MISVHSAPNERGRGVESEENGRCCMSRDEIEEERRMEREENQKGKEEDGTDSMIE